MVHLVNMSIVNCIKPLLQVSRAANLVFVRTGIRIPKKVAVRKSIDNKVTDIPKDKKLESYLDSLEAKGFLRSHKAYEPPSDVEEQIKRVCAEFMDGKDLNKNLRNLEFKDRTQRFHILTKCMQVFDHEITNSQLHKISTIGNLIKYFQMPIRSTSSYDDLYASENLPPNLHVMLEPIRFHPDTDTMFGGITAYPGRSTIVSGLKSKKKFKGFTTMTPYRKIFKRY